jgi:hypothetical protein
MTGPREQLTLIRPRKCEAFRLVVFRSYAILETDRAVTLRNFASKFREVDLVMV